MIDYRKVGKGDKVIDCLNEEFIVLKKVEGGIRVYDLQDRSKYRVPKECAKELGETIVKGWVYGTRYEEELE